MRELKTAHSKEYVYLYLEDVIVTVSESGDILYEDENYTWSYPDDGGRYWVTEGDVPEPKKFISAEEVSEDAATFYETMIPFNAGKYSISCDIILAYDVEYSYISEPFVDEDDEPAEYIESVEIEDVTFDKEDSEMNNFKCRKI